MEDKELHTISARIHAANLRHAVENDERMVLLMKILQAQIEIVTAGVEGDSLPDLQDNFRALLARVESEHELHYAEMRDLEQLLSTL